MKKRLLHLSLLALLLLSTNVFASNIVLKVNDKIIDNLPVSPQVINDRVFVPLREMMEHLGANVGWVSNEKRIYLSYEDKLIEMQIANKEALINGKSVTMETAPMISNNKTLIPLRFAAEHLGFQVDWDKNLRIASIDTNQTPTEETTVTNNNEIIDINSITLTDNISQFSFRINASDEIKDFKQEIIDNKLVIDIYNSILKVDNNNIQINDNNDVSAIRSSQFATEPQLVSRIVFDLKGTNDHAVFLSTDKKAIVVSFAKNIIQKTELTSNSNSDILKIVASSTFSKKITVLDNPKRIVIDISNAELSASLDRTSGTFVNDLRISQHTDSSVRIVLEVKEDTRYVVADNGNESTITVLKSTPENIAYDSQTNTLKLKKASNVSMLAAIVHQDLYEQNKYIINLGANYSKHFENFNLNVNDTNINSFEISSAGSQSEIIFNTKNLRAFKVNEDENYLYIRNYAPKELYSKIVVIDAGHGATDPGACANNLQEKDLNLNIAKKMNDLLKTNNPEIKVYMTRNYDTNPSWNDRTYKWNGIADLYVSVHINSATNLSASGTEVLYTDNSIDSPYGITSKSLAETAQKNLVQALSTKSRGIVNRPKLIVLNRATYPAILAEIAFLSNQEDAKLLADDSKLGAAANALYKTIVDSFEQCPPKR